VVVGGEEGYVRKISVRSTELETFDRAHVLIPNSYFVSEKVKNWTFRNNIRRIAIPIGVAYDSDPRQVQAVLLKVAADNPDVLKNTRTGRHARRIRPRKREFYALRFHRRYRQNRRRSHRAFDGDPYGVCAKRHRDSVRTDRRHHPQNGLAARHRCQLCSASGCATCWKWQPHTFIYRGGVNRRAAF